jgi:hypothetical protein
MKPHKLVALALSTLALIDATAAFASDVAVSNPLVSGRPVDRCIREGASRCETAARERVADEACRSQGFTEARNGTATYRGGFPRAVSIFDARRAVFVEGLGADTIATVTCVVPDPVISLVSPADRAQVAVAATTGRTVSNSRMSEAVRLSWTARNMLTTHSIVGCLQRTSNFVNTRFACDNPVVAWSGDFRLTYRGILHSQLSSEIGRTLYWSVRACEASASGNLVSGAQRLNCTNWITPRSLQIVSPTPPPPAITFNTHLLPVFQSERCMRCHEAYLNRPQPAWHTNGSTSWPPAGSCVGCHSATRAGVAGWQGPANNAIEFRNRSPQQLCQMAKTGTTSHPQWQQHLKEDPLILWAIATARVPAPGSGTASQTLQRAFNGSTQQWINLINQWSDAGAPCQ